MQCPTVFRMRDVDFPSGRVAHPCGFSRARLLYLTAAELAVETKSRSVNRGKGEKQIPLYATRRTQTVRKKKPGRSARNDSVNGGRALCRT
jgi:hypothetical protein